MKNILEKASKDQVLAIKKYAPYINPRKLDNQQWALFVNTGKEMVKINTEEIGHILETDAISLVLLSNAYAKDPSKIGLFGGFVVGEFPGDPNHLAATFEIEGGGVAVMHYVLINGKLYVGGIKQPRPRIQSNDPKKKGTPAIIFNAVRGYLPPKMSRLDAAKMEAHEEAERYGVIREIKLPPNIWNTGTHSLRGKRGFTYASCEWKREALTKVGNYYIPNTEHPDVKKALGDAHEKISTGLQFYPWKTIIEGKVPGCARFPNDGLTLVGVMYLIEDLIKKGDLKVSF